MAREFNKQLKETVARLRTQLPLAAITYVDVYAAKLDLIANFSKHGKLINKCSIEYAKKI